MSSPNDQVQNYSFNDGLSINNSLSPSHVEGLKEQLRTVKKLKSLVEEERILAQALNAQATNSIPQELERIQSEKQVLASQLANQSQLHTSQVLQNPGPKDSQTQNGDVQFGRFADHAQAAIWVNHGINTAGVVYPSAAQRQEAVVSALDSQPANYLIRNNEEYQPDISRPYPVYQSVNKEHKPRASGTAFDLNNSREYIRESSDLISSQKLVSVPEYTLNPAGHYVEKVSQRASISHSELRPAQSAELSPDQLRALPFEVEYGVSRRDFAPVPSVQETPNEKHLLSQIDAPSTGVQSPSLQAHLDEIVEVTKCGVREQVCSDSPAPVDEVTQASFTQSQSHCIPNRKGDWGCPPVEYCPPVVTALPVTLDQQSSPLKEAAVDVEVASIPQPQKEIKIENQKFQNPYLKEYITNSQLEVRARAPERRSEYFGESPKLAPQQVQEPALNSSQSLVRSNSHHTIKVSGEFKRAYFKPENDPFVTGGNPVVVTETQELDDQVLRRSYMGSSRIVNIVERKKESFKEAEPRPTPPGYKDEPAQRTYYLPSRSLSNSRISLQSDRQRSGVFGGAEKSVEARNGYHMNGRPVFAYACTKQNSVQQLCSDEYGLSSDRR